jgi:hypothetical protein
MATRGGHHVVEGLILFFSEAVNSYPAHCGKWIQIHGNHCVDCLVKAIGKRLVYARSESERSLQQLTAKDILEELRTKNGSIWSVKKL